jgi:hypothetical protein
VHVAYNGVEVVQLVGLHAWIDLFLAIAHLLAHLL